ncbi:MAG: hypothetical protein MUE55_08440 [Thermoplasmata archaeon]|nr:hypothetical protein [Thermoplasmata archaeon]
MNESFVLFVTAMTSSVAGTPATVSLPWRYSPVESWTSAEASVFLGTER